MFILEFPLSNACDAIYNLLEYNDFMQLCL